MASGEINESFKLFAGSPRVDGFARQGHAFEEISRSSGSHKRRARIHQDKVAPRSLFPV